MNINSNEDRFLSKKSTSIKLESSNEEKIQSKISSMSNQQPKL